MTEDITAEKLREYGFHEDEISRLFTCKTQVPKIRDGIYIACSETNKIYSGKEAGKMFYLKPGRPEFPYCCIDLVPDYYAIKEQGYLAVEREIAGILYNENIKKEEFKLLEIQWANLNISLKRQDINRFGAGFLKKAVKDVKQLESYLAWLAIPREKLLSNFQCALKQWYLEKYANEPTLQGSEIGKKYGSQKVEQLLNAIRKNKKPDIHRRGYRQDLQKVYDSLVDSPDLQKVVINDLEQLD